MQQTPNVGRLITGPNEGRDAIHVAVAPVTAAEDLDPGEHVGLTGTGEAAAEDYPVERIGIVDPYLEHGVKAGQRFWLFLYPGSVTSLRHVWTHPAFKPKVPQ